MEATKNVPNLRLHALFLLCLSIAATSAAGDPSFHPSNELPGPFPRHEYTRFADVMEGCQSVLPYATELGDDVADRFSVMMEQLSFMNGDWSQDDAGQAPLLPFEGTYADTGPESLEAVRLASFVLTHMDTVPRRGERKALNVSGILSLAITRNCTWPVEKVPSCPEFQLRSGVTELHIPFEGIYAEPRNNEGRGERVLCMLGYAVRPMRASNSSDPWNCAKKTHSGDKSNMEEPVVIADNEILLVLRYPNTHTLTNHAVRGEMMSACTESDRTYFDKVRLVSRLRRHFSRYQFWPELLEFTAGQNCSRSSPLRDGDRAEHLYRGASFCDILHQFASVDNGGVLDVVPNWNCNSTDEFCSRVGPFETTSRSALFTRSAIAVQGLQCEPVAGGMDGSTAAARVSAVFRFLPPWEHQRTSAWRTSLGGMTLSAEGTWTASLGRLCMVACRGIGPEAACHHRVTLHVPTTFAITRRGIVVGQITSTNGSHPPLTFQQRVSPTEPWDQFGRTGESLPMAYEYTKVKQAGEILRRREPSGIRDHFIAKPFLSYPKIAAGAADDMASLSNLADDLSFDFYYRSKPQFVPEWIKEPFVEFQILSIGRLVGRYFQDGPGMPVDRGHGVEKHHILMNVSAAFRASSREFLGSITVMSLEGVYNTGDGRMHLIGCRVVHAPWRVLSKSRDLEDGMDCSIEVTVEYPPATMRWLISPVAKVYVASTRDAGDPLHFNRTELHTMPIIYRDRRDQLTEPEVEGLLFITVLSATIAATISQLHYIRSHPDVAPYVSLAMLGVQILGHIATLVTDAKMLASSYRTYVDHRGWNMDCSVKALTVAALLLTARLAQKVWRSRACARARSPLEPGRVPSDTAVLLYSFVAHLGVLTVHRLSADGTLEAPPSRVLHGGAGEEVRVPPLHVRPGADVVEWYAGVVNQWFLLPQVIGNAVWRVNCKPLEVRYYAGITSVWLLPHIYGYLRPPVVGTYYDGAHDDVMDFYSKVGAMVVPAVGLLLAVAVYVQQRWNYKFIGWATRTEQNKLQHVC